MNHGTHKKHENGKSSLSGPTQNLPVGMCFFLSVVLWPVEWFSYKIDFLSFEGESMKHIVYYNGSEPIPLGSAERKKK